MHPTRLAAVLTSLLVLVVLATGPVPTSSAAGAAPVRTTYANPLRPTMPGGRTVEGCADPAVLQGAGAQARYWYMYCTSDPLDDVATSGPGAPVSTRLPTLRSTDLVHWSLVGSALDGRPAWSAAGTALWAPDAVYSSTYHRYYLTFAVTNTATSVSGEPGCAKDAAIGVAVSTSPTGPWRTASRPLVPPRRLGPGCDFASTIDPDVLGGTVTDRSVLYSGGFRGGIWAQAVRLSRTGMRLTGTATAVTADRRYEAANVVTRGGWHYLVVSSGSCCQGVLSGYGVFVGRSRSPYGPFLDRQGAPLLAGRTGGTPFLVTNGNRWIGPGHTSVFTDRGGRWWTMYHAVDRADPTFAGRPGLTRRAPLLDPVVWSGGWPSVRAGAGPSTARTRAPAGRAHTRSTYTPAAVAADVPGDALPASSDDFDGDALDPAWTWLRPPPPASYAVSGGRLRWDTQAGGLAGDDPTAAVLQRPAPAGDFVAQVAVRLDVPAEGCCQDYVQAGLLVRAADDRYVRLAHVSIGDTRQVEFGSRVPTADPGAQQAGATTVGPPGDTTWLRLVRRSTAAGQLFRAYSSRDGSTWVRGGTWLQTGMADHVQLGLVSLGGSGHTAEFDDLRVWRLRG